MGTALKSVVTLLFQGGVPTLPGSRMGLWGGRLCCQVCVASCPAAPAGTLGQPGGCCLFQGTHWLHQQCWLGNEQRLCAPYCLWFRAFSLLYPCTVLFKGLEVYSPEEGEAKSLPHSSCLLTDNKILLSLGGR